MVKVKPLVIAFITSYFPYIGGAEISLRQIAQQLSDDFDFLILTARYHAKNSAHAYEKEGEIWRLGIACPLDKWLLPLAVPAIRRRIAAERREGRSLVLWGLDISQASLAATVTRWSDALLPFVLTIQYGEPPQRLAQGRRGMIRRSFKFMLANADHVTAISTPLIETARLYGHDGPMSYIPNGVDLDLFKPGGRRKSKVSPIVVSVSRLVPKNGIDTLLRAMALLVDRFSRIECRIVGSGLDLGALQELVVRLNLGAHVRFLGELPHHAVVQHLQESDVFVRPSRSEGMGNAFAEAMAMGLPVIGTRVGGIVDLIDDGQTGLFVSANQPADVAEKISSVLVDRALAARLAKQGQAFVREHYDMRESARLYAGVFRGLLGS